MILVCGATGTVGGEVLRLLCESDTPTRALVRSPEKADLLPGYDCETAIDDAASLDAALAGTEAVFLASPASRGGCRSRSANRCATSTRVRRRRALACSPTAWTPGWSTADGAVGGVPGGVRRGGHRRGAEGDRPARALA